MSRESRINSNIDNYKNNFIALISKRLGIQVKQDNTDLINVVNEACTKFDCTAAQYLKLLESCNENSPLLEHLVSGITIGETYFFRDKRQMDLLQNNLLPRIIKSKRMYNNLTLRIWSAGCASGEEIYTIAMMLHELLPDITKWSISLLATDINLQVLQKAKIGKYNKWSMRSINNYYLKQYFKDHNNSYQILDEISDMVDFQYLNLNDDTYPSILNNTNSQDVIICRNVLIYFSNEVVARLMKKFTASLNTDGYLLLGASDPVIIEGTNLVFHHNDGMLFSHSNEKTLSHQKTHKRVDLSPTPVIKSEIKKKNQPTKAAILNPSNNKLKEPSTISQITLLNTKAKEAANLGQLDAAVKYCENCLLLDATNKDTYFTYALTLIELNRLDEAEAAFRKVIFLDRNFVEGHFQLGLLLLKKHQYNSGMKSLYNALKIVEKNDPDQIVAGSEGLTYRRFSDILKAEIELYNGLKGVIYDK